MTLGRPLVRVWSAGSGVAGRLGETQGRPDWESGRPAGREWRRVWAAGYPGSMRSRIAIAQRCWHPLEHRPVRPGGVLTERSGPPVTNAGQLSLS